MQICPRLACKIACFCRQKFMQLTGKNTGIAGKNTRQTQAKIIANAGKNTRTIAGKKTCSSTQNYQALLWEKKVHNITREPLDFSNVLFANMKIKKWKFQYFSRIHSIEKKFRYRFILLKTLLSINSPVWLGVRKEYSTVICPCFPFLFDFQKDLQRFIQH